MKIMGFLDVYHLSNGLSCISGRDFSIRNRFRQCRGYIDHKFEDLPSHAIHRYGLGYELYNVLFKGRYITPILAQVQLE